MIKKRILLVLCILQITSCNSFYGETYNLIATYISGGDKLHVTKKFYDEFPYSFAQLKIGRSNPIIVVLSDVNNDIYKWVSSDNVILFTSNGKIVETFGLPNDIKIKFVKDFPYENNFSARIDFMQPVLENQKISYELNQLEDINYFNRLETQEQVEVYEELFKVDSIRWKSRNTYYLINNQVVRSRTNIHPDLPVITIDFYLK